MRESLKKMVNESDRKVVKEWTKEGIWRLQIKHGPVGVFLEHSEKMRFVKVIFPINVENNEIQQKLSEVFNDPKDGAQVIYLLRSTINNPCCGFLVQIVDSKFQGFQILMNIFPFEANFSIRDLDQAIQNVVSVGIAGVDFLKALLGDIELQQKAIDAFPRTDPDGMFG
jgi:hypothetical protein